LLITSPADDGKFVVGERLMGIALLGKFDGDIKVSAPLAPFAAFAARSSTMWG